MAGTVNVHEGLALQLSKRMWRLQNYIAVMDREESS
jgi:hypothetical protein